MKISSSFAKSLKINAYKLRTLHRTIIPCVELLPDYCFTFYDFVFETEAMKRDNALNNLQIFTRYMITRAGPNSEGI
jgi:hypothetical protein